MIYSSLDQLPLHEKISTQLRRSIRSKNHHHAYLLYGTEGSGKKAIALHFARHFICTQNMQQPCGQCPSCIKFEKLQHPDLTILAAVNKKNDLADEASLDAVMTSLIENEFKPLPHFASRGYYVDSIRKLKSDSKFSGTEAPYKVIILFDIEFMNASSANAFLKLLEEPPMGTVIIMTTNNIHGILPTITSRCLKMQIPLPTNQQIQQILVKSQLEDPSDLIVNMSNQSISNVFEIKELLEHGDRNSVLDFLRFSIVLKPIEVNSIVQKITSSKSKDAIDLFLIMLQLWFRDANILLQNESDTAIINKDFRDELVKFTSKYTEINFIKIDEIIEKTRKQIYSNANASMQLVSLSIEINENIRAS